MSKPFTTTTTAFAEIVAPLERASGRRLGNPARTECLRAFEKHPEGVREVARGALADAGRNPVGLFVHRIRNGWHELEVLPEDASGRDAGSAARPARFTLAVDHGDKGVQLEAFDDRAAYESRAAELERELGAHNVTRFAA